MMREKIERNNAIIKDIQAGMYQVDIAKKYNVSPVIIAKIKKRYSHKLLLGRTSGMVRRAVKTGKIKELPCVICGEKADAHHEDYSKVLKVIWLCKAHHKQLHLK